jgi:hypothetical protein
VWHRTGFGFDDRIYWTFIHFTNHYLRLDTLDFWPHYTNPLLYYWNELRCTPFLLFCNTAATVTHCYIASQRIHGKHVHCLTINILYFCMFVGTCLLSRCLPMDMARTDIENTSCNTCSIAACVYCGRCRAIGLLKFWLLICYGLVYRVVGLTVGLCVTLLCSPR